MMVLLVLLIPFMGTCLGALAIYVVHKNLNKTFEKIMLGIASGIMVAASIWSLLIPALETKSSAIFQVVIGISFGVLCFYFLDLLFLNKKNIDKTMLAITIHNVPEGMAVGVVLASCLLGKVSIYSCLALALGIAVQNFPEGFIVSFPLLKKGYSKKASFAYGVVSAFFELLGAVVTILFTNFVVFLLPFFLSFAAGAMFYVVILELLPEARLANRGEIFTFMGGFLLMMVLDVLLG